MALKIGDWAEAAMMLSASARLNFGSNKTTGAAEGDLNKRMRTQGRRGGDKDGGGEY